MKYLLKVTSKKTNNCLLTFYFNLPQICNENTKNFEVFFNLISNFDINILKKLLERPKFFDSILPDFSDLKIVKLK